MRYEVRPRCFLIKAFQDEHLEGFRECRRKAWKIEVRENLMILAYDTLGS